jgi:hypothetical protein
MTGLNIFTHSILLVIRNFAAALRISFLLWAAPLALVAWASGSIMVPDPMQPGMPQGNPFESISFGPLIIGLVLTLIAYLWIAVAWHRFVLLEENPGAVLPKWRGSALKGYFIKGLLLVLALLVAAIPLLVLMVALSGILAQSLVSMLIFQTLASIPLMYLFYRLSLILPAAALGNSMGFGDSWATTERISGPIAGVAIYTVIAGVLLNVLSSVLVLSGVGSFLPVLVQAITQWVSMMVGVSIMTTLYGYLIEDRGLD